MNGSVVTRRSLFYGLLCALVMCAVNSFLTLKVGIIEEAAVLSTLIFVMFAQLSKQKTVTRGEAVVVATIGSAGATLAFLANFFAALALSGRILSWWEATLFVLAVCSLGLVFAIPMRQLFVVKDPLAWPTGRVVINAIQAMINSEDVMQTRTLGFFAVVSFLYILFSAGVPWFPEVSIIKLFGLGAFLTGIAWSPFIFGAGYLVGVRVGFGFLIAGLILVFMGPHTMDYVQGTLTHVPPHKYIWPGVMALVTSGLTALVINGRSLIGAFKSLGAKGSSDKSAIDQVVSGKTLIVLMTISFLFAAVVLNAVFDVPFKLAAIALFVSVAICDLVATRAYGESAFNPVRIMGILLIGLFVAMGVSDVTLALVAAGIASGAIIQTGILVSDSYFGRHFGVPARLQVSLQAMVLIPVALIVGLIFKLIAGTYQIGSDALPAPIATAWYAMAEVLSGKAQLPPFAVQSMWIGGFGGILLAILDWVAAQNIKRVALCNEHLQGSRRGKLGGIPAITVKTVWRFWPASVGICIGLILPIFYDFSFFLGAVVLCWLLPKVFNLKDNILSSVAAAGIVGEGLGQLVVGILKALGVFTS